MVASGPLPGALVDVWLAWLGGMDGWGAGEREGLMTREFGGLFIVFILVSSKVSPLTEGWRWDSRGVDGGGF